jgi:uncharacterized protein YcbK (DUF882 family)
MAKLTDYITKNFQLQEFLLGRVMPKEAHLMALRAYEANRFGEKQNVQKIADWLQTNIRDVYGATIINSGLRAREWEIRQGRQPGQKGYKTWSTHTKGLAVDFRCTNLTNAQHIALYEKLKKTHLGGVAIYIRRGIVGFIHIDLEITSPARRWTY